MNNTTSCNGMFLSFFAWYRLKVVLYKTHMNLISITIYYDRFQLGPLHFSRSCACLFIWVQLYPFFISSSIPNYLLPRPLFLPSVILSCRQFLRNVCPNKDVFLFIITLSSFLYSPILINTSSFLTLSVDFTLVILRQKQIMKLSGYLSFWRSTFHCHKNPHSK